VKKILVAVLVLVASTTSVFAVDTTKYEVFNKMNNASTFNGLLRYLEADYDQADQLELVFTMTEKKMKSALKGNDEVAAEKAMYFNLGNVKSVLSEEQYKKYLVLINVSVYNNYTDTFIAGL
jgi:hypothetical protein